MELYLIELDVSYVNRGEKVENVTFMPRWFKWQKRLMLKFVVRSEGIVLVNF